MIFFEQYVLLVGCLYADGSRMVWEVHRGSRESCEKVQLATGGVVVSAGDEMPVKAETIVAPAAKYDELLRKVRQRA